MKTAKLIILLVGVLSLRAGATTFQQDYVGNGADHVSYVSATSGSHVFGVNRVPPRLGIGSYHYRGYYRTSASASWSSEDFSYDSPYAIGDDPYWTTSVQPGYQIKIVVRDDAWSVLDVFLWAVKDVTCSISSKSIASSSGSFSIGGTANTSYSIADDASWISASPSSGSADINGASWSSVVSYSANSSINSRNATITIAGGSVTRTIAMTQAGAAHSLSVSKTAVLLSASGGSDTVTATSNNGWSYAYTVGQWLTCSYSGTTLTISAAPNTTTSERTAYVDVFDNDVCITKRVTVTQQAAPTRILSLSGDLSFGAVELGHTVTKQVTISNLGNSALNVWKFALSIPTTNFVRSGFMTGIIPAGGSEVASITFTPTTTNLLNGAMIFHSDGGTGTCSFSGSGICFPFSINASAGVYTDKVQITWNAQDVPLYALYRKSVGGDLELLTNTTSLSFADASAVPGVTYLYSVWSVKYQLMGQTSGWLRVSGKDLVIENVSYTSGMYYSGDVLNLTGSEENRGNVDVPPSPTFLIQGILSPSTNWNDPGRAVIFEGIENEGLDAGEVWPETVPVVLPSSLTAGNYYLGLRIDVTNSVTEDREDNNIWWSAAPDIVIQPALQTYYLTVDGGTGDGAYTNGARITVVGITGLPDGQVFDRWIGDTQYVESVTSSTTIVTMPAQAVTLTATYKAVSDNVSATQTSGGYTAGGTAVINCSFSYTGTLLGLMWQPVLPSGWTVQSVSGDGTPEYQGSGIVFTGGTLPNPVNFSYTVAVPAGTTGTCAVSGTATYQLNTMVNPTSITAQPDPLNIIPGNSYHSADYQNPRWKVDDLEIMRALAYWRAGAYHVDTSSVDGYASGSGSTNGARHSADYSPTYWKIDDLEIMRVLAYWRARVYHSDTNGVDGFASGSAPPGTPGGGDPPPVTPPGL